VLPFIAILGESGPLFEVRWDVKRFEGLLMDRIRTYKDL
jgi:hypothetical protein